MSLQLKVRLLEEVLAKHFIDTEIFSVILLMSFLSGSAHHSLGSLNMACKRHLQSI